VELGRVLPTGRSARLRQLTLRPAARPAAPEAAWLRARLSAPDTTPADETIGWADDAAFAGAELIEAAVLVPIVTGPNPGVLLTKRTTTLRNHAGQVSFPGGRIDPQDASPEAAALREAHEEVGLDPAQVELVGRLRPYVTGTGYRVTPILGLLPPSLNLVHAPAEVDAIFELPLTTLLDPAAPERRSAEYRGRLRHYWVWPHPDHHIWGATAAILVHLARRLREEG
jgi:8-oxo-dGTP pyrophosphatase MutT (NUDIX family)